MTPQQRVQLIADVADALCNRTYSIIDLHLDEFGFPTNEQSNGTEHDYVLSMLRQGRKQGDLAGLAEAIGVLPTQPNPSGEPTFWKPAELRVFLSHLAAHKKDMTSLQSALKRYGIASFVAHEDIEPSTKWQEQIESAIGTMDALVAYLTPGFKESHWTDQEVGAAIGRGIPVIPVRKGLDPYGFIGSIQGVTAGNKPVYTLASEILECLHRHDSLKPKLLEAAVQAIENAGSFDAANKAIERLETYEGVNATHVDRIEAAKEANGQVSGAWSIDPSLKRIKEKIGYVEESDELDW